METTRNAYGNLPPRSEARFGRFADGVASRTSVFAVLAAVVAVLFLSVVCGAQTAGTGAIAGNITDPSKALVADATVTATNKATGETRTVTSTSSGGFLIPLLHPGNYQVSVSKNGFKQATFNAVPVNVTETRRLDVELQVGAANESVEVHEQGDEMKTETSALGNVTTSREVEGLPLVTRNYTQIIGLSPGVATSVTNAGDLGRGTGSSADGAFVSHGTTSRDNNFQMNGVEINDLQGSGSFSGGVAVPNPDTIQEFKVQTGQYDATYGHNAGANVDVVTKGGSNNFHGSVFEYFRNEVLNANDYFRKQTKQDRPVLRQNQYGFALGGPIKKDKLLFFGSYQGTKQKNGVSTSCSSNFSSPPLTNDRSRAALGQLFAGQPTFAKQLGLGGPTVLADGSNISPQALALLQMKLPNGQYLIPTPQTVDPTKKFAIQGTSTFSDPCTFDENQFMTNGDFLQSDKSKISARFFWANSLQSATLPTTNLGGPPTPGFPLNTHDEFRNASLAHSYVFSPRLVNQLELAYHRQVASTIQQEAFHFSDVGVNAPPTDNIAPEITITGAMTLGGNGQSVVIVQNHYDLQDTLFYSRGRHSFRFGGGIIRSHNDVESFQYIGGLLFQTFPDFLLGQSAAQNGTPFSNVLVSVDLAGLFPRQWRAWDGNAFAQDDIKLTSHFTLNLGFRYERLGDLSDKLGRNSGFDPRLAVATPPAAGTLAGYVVSSNYTGPMPAGVTRLDNEIGFNGDGQNTMNPRVGFAWQLPHFQRFVLRGGFGTYHTRSTGQPLFQLLATPPFSVIRIVQTTANGGATFANPFAPSPTVPFFPPYSPTTALSVATFAPDFRPPVSQQYSLNLQTEITHDFVLEVGYVGSRGTHLIRTVNINQAQLASTANPIRGVTTNTLANVAQRVPIEGFQASGLTQYQSQGASWYNSLEASLRKRFSHGLQFLAAYTYGRDLTTNYGTSTGANGAQAVGDQTKPHYGPDPFIREQRLVVSYVYNLPSPAGSGWKSEFLGGWQLAGVSTFQSGQRLTATNTNSTNIYGISNDFANVVQGCDASVSGSVDEKLNNYINTACITKPAVIGSDGKATDFGNAVIGLIHGPDQRNTDLAIIKKTALRWPVETTNLEFRTELFNAFNTPQFANPTTSFSSATFGKISSTAVSPRIVQFALKLNF